MPDRKLLYIIGAPGVGKTTVVRKLLRKVKGEYQREPYVYFTSYGNGCIQLGYDRENFGGTDTLGMAVQKHLQEWLLGCDYTHILAEGDRLANKKFFDWCLESGFTLKIVCLEVSDSVAQKRLDARNAKIGKTQNARWIKTRRSKIDNLKQQFGDHMVVLDGNRPVKEILNDLRKFAVVKAILRNAK